MLKHENRGYSSIFNFFGGELTMKFKKHFTVLVMFMLLLCVGVVSAVDNSSDEGTGSITYEESEDDFVPQDDNTTDDSDDENNTVSLMKHATSNPIWLLLAVVTVLGCVFAKNN